MTARNALHALLLTLACAVPLLIAAGIYWFGVYYALETSTPLVSSDAWWFVEAWLVPLQDGTLQVADLWTKRHGNHAQPLAALLFLANAKWFGLDFGLETAFGLALATTYCAALLFVARRYAAPHTPLHAAWVVAAIVCIVFSVNSKEKLSWSLVALFYLGHMLGLALLWLSARQRRAPYPGTLFAGGFAVCALVDTTGVLWCLSAMLVLLLTRDSEARRAAWPLARGALALLAAIAVYQLTYRWLAPPPSGPPGPGLLAALQILWQQAGSAGLAVMPFGSAIAAPERLEQVLGGSGHEGLVFTLAAFCLGAHGWLWWTALRRPVNEGFAIACGLALFGYATIAGIVLQRVPEMGYGYLLQPRYGVFFDLLWIAPVLGWACRPARTEGRGLRFAAASLLALPLMISTAWIDWAFTEMQWIRGWNHWLARDTWRVMQDPRSVPTDCHPRVVVCGWPLPLRERLVGALHAGPFNLASPRFRAAHGLEAELREAERAAAPAPSIESR